MFARNNSSQLELIPDNMLSMFEDTHVNPFIQVPEIQVPFVNISYSIIDGIITPPTLYHLKAQVKAKLAEFRYSREVGGIKLPSGFTISTTRESQGQLASAYSSMKNGLIASVNWKNIDGSWTILTISKLEVIAKSVAEYVSNCFYAESEHVQAIDALDTADELYAYNYSVNYPLNGFEIS